jgi:hypothetical protein
MPSTVQLAPTPPGTLALNCSACVSVRVAILGESVTGPAGTTVTVAWAVLEVPPAPLQVSA